MGYSSNIVFSISLDVWAGNFIQPNNSVCLNVALKSSLRDAVMLGWVEPMDGVLAYTARECRR